MNDRADPVDATIGSYPVLHEDPGKWRLVAAIG